MEAPAWTAGQLQLNFAPTREGGYDDDFRAARLGLQPRTNGLRIEKLRRDVDSQAGSRLLDDPIERPGVVAIEPHLAVIGLGPRLDHDLPPGLQQVAMRTQDLRHEHDLVFARGV